MRESRTARLTGSVYASILRHAESEPAAEVCGLIGGRRGLMEAVHPVANIAADPRRRFEMDGRDQLGAMRKISECGETWLGIYHSHIMTPAVPSTIDLDRHAYPDAISLIVAPAMAETERVRAFLIRDRAAWELPLEIVAPARTSGVSNLKLK
ncbi:MAG: M67 family metallopeptidase [Gammaproteobacteria bacterium]|nr:M67 family metallopeptidase [Gammaproteobacteria bacterium]